MRNNSVQLDKKSGRKFKLIVIHDNYVKGLRNNDRKKSKTNVHNYIPEHVQKYTE